MASEFFETPFRFELFLGDLGEAKTVTARARAVARRRQMRLADLSFVLTAKCRRIRAQQSASSLNFVLHQLARVLRVARRMRSRCYF
jgi:hypothetical protein